MSAMHRIRQYYGVPAKRGMHVIFDGQPGTITGTVRGHMHLRVRLDDGQLAICHPTWRMEYPI